MTSEVWVGAGEGEGMGEGLWGASSGSLFVALGVGVGVGHRLVAHLLAWGLQLVSVGGPSWVLQLRLSLRRNLLCRRPYGRWLTSLHVGSLTGSLGRRMKI